MILQKIVIIEPQNFSKSISIWKSESINEKAQKNPLNYLQKYSYQTTKLIKAHK